VLCPDCGLDQPTGNRFCEDCGGRLEGAPAAACPECGAGPADLDADGFCRRCGLERVPPARDHLEIVLSPHFAGVSDRGRCHPRNEDYLALASDAAAEILVVCDGVSNSARPDEAAAVAAATACAALRESLHVGGPSALEAALRAADAAVTTIPYSPSDAAEPPECTIVAAVRHGRTLSVAWLGDSRAYFITPQAAVQLTEDHSWLTEVVASGEMTLAEALQSPKAHAITRTLGGCATGDEPSLRTYPIPDGPGHLLLCTDGLWNYAREPAQLAELVHGFAASTDALGLARRLVDYARDRRGHDNITVALLALGGSP
jgi:serine/threonine protein phosphatase PrpC